MTDWLEASTTSMDHAFMVRALRAATRGLGAASPNPCVGAVITQGDEVVGRGGHAKAGEAHAEVVALAEAAARAQGSTVYVTLEPCCHQGRQPACSEALIHAEVARVVIGIRDPDVRVSGQGIDALRQAGIDVEVGLLASACSALNPGYLHRQRSGRARLVLKTATTLESAVATREGESQWITGPESRRRVHELRARMASVMVGAGTVRHDAPKLTARWQHAEPWWRRNAWQPHRLVASRSGRVPSPKGEGGPTWLIGASGAPPGDFDHGLEGAQSWADILTQLADHGINEVLCEGGAGLASELLRAGVVDEWIQMVAPMTLTGSGLPAVVGDGVSELEHARRGHLARLEQLGQDACLWTVFDDGPTFADQTGLLEALEHA